MIKTDYNWKGFDWTQLGRRVNLDSLPESQKMKSNAQKVIESLQSLGAKGILYLKGNETAVRKFCDTELVFRQDSSFFYLTGINLPDLHIILNLQTKTSHLYVPESIHDADHIMWCGRGPEFQEFKSVYGIDHVSYTSSLESALKNASEIHTLESFPGISSQTELATLAITECRVVKSQQEIELIRQACEISAKAHIALMKAVGTADNERQLHALFEYYCHKNGFENI